MRFASLEEAVYAAAALFKQGAYADAYAAYTASLNVGGGVLTALCNNLSQSLLDTHEYSDSIRYSFTAFALSNDDQSTSKAMQLVLTALIHLGGHDTFFIP